MFLIPLEDYEERLLPEMLLSLQPSPCSSHSLQLSRWNLLWAPLNTKICSHRDLTEIRQYLREIQPSIAGHMWVANSTVQMAWGRKTVTLNGRCTFSTGLVREALQLLCSLLVRKHICTSPKVCTSRLGMHSTKKCRVSPDNAEVLRGSAIQAVIVHLCAASCWVVQVTLCRVSQGVPRMEMLKQHVHTPGMPSEQRLALMEGTDSWLFTVVSAQTKPLCSGQRSYLLVKGYQLLIHHRKASPRFLDRTFLYKPKNKQSLVNNPMPGLNLEMFPNPETSPCFILSKKKNHKAIHSLKAYSS